MTYHPEPGKANGGRLVKARTENLSKSMAIGQQLIRVRVIVGRFG